MNVHLDYGRTGLDVEVPNDVSVILPEHLPGLSDETIRLRSAIRQPIKSPPLTSLLKPGDRVVIAHSDMTRATPNERILPVLLEEIESSGVRREDITLLNALGAHRLQTEMETRALLGDNIVDHYRCIQHDCTDPANLLSLGTTCFGHPVRLNRILVEADVKILTGFIEPHFYAGFSGGPKCILPGLAGMESVLSNHGQDMLAHPKATWGITNGNPVWEEMMDMALRLEKVFLLNVTLNRTKQITNIFAGDLQAAHQAGCEYARIHSMIHVDLPFDVVLSTNSGYPLDQNLYQCAKGMNAASQIVRPGGAIILIAACEDGIPDGGHYDRLITEARSLHGIREMLSRPGFVALEQWMLQIQAMIQEKADVYVYSDGLNDEKIHRTLFLPCRNIPEMLEELIKKHGKRVCVLPEGHQVIAYL